MQAKVVWRRLRWERRRVGVGVGVGGLGSESVVPGARMDWRWVISVSKRSDQWKEVAESRIMRDRGRWCEVCVGRDADGDESVLVDGVRFGSALRR